MITIEDAGKSFGRKHLWQHVHLSITDGEVVAIVGPSGSGKSTLLNCIGLLDELDEGIVSMDGVVMSGRSPRRQRLFRKNRLGYLFQNYALIESATIGQNLDVVTGPWERWRHRGAVREREAGALAHVGLAGRERDQVFTLSGGEQQRVALARLIVKQPSVILADEPTGALDETNAVMVMDTLRHLANQGSTVVIATHSPLVVERCDKVFDLSAHHQENSLAAAGHEPAPATRARQRQPTAPHRRARRSATGRRRVDRASSTEPAP